MSPSCNLQTTAFQTCQQKPSQMWLGFVFIVLFLFPSTLLSQTLTQGESWNDILKMSSQGSLIDPGTCCLCTNYSPVYQRRTGEDSIMLTVGLEDKWKRTEAMFPSHSCCKDEGESGLSAGGRRSLLLHKEVFSPYPWHCTCG